MSDYDIPEDGFEFPPPPTGFHWHTALHVTGDIRVSLLNYRGEERYSVLIDRPAFCSNPRDALDHFLDGYRQRLDEDAKKDAFDRALKKAAERANGEVSGNVRLPRG